MVVDDEPDIVYVLRLILEREGHEVVQASSGEECLEKLEAEEVDLVLLDDLMPGMDGWEVLKRIRGDRRLNSTPVVVVTAMSPKRLAKKRETLDTAYYLPKPFNREDLLELIEYAADKTKRD
jgi:CheY-like chemotaxis protein